MLPLAAGLFSGVGLLCCTNSRAHCESKSYDSYETHMRIERKFSIYGKCELKLFTGNAHPALAEEMAVCLNKPLDDILIKTQASGETWVEIKHSVRDADVFLLQPTCRPCPNNFIMELLIMIDAAKRAGAARVTAVIPVFGYGRQDRKSKSRDPISAKVIGDILQTAGVDRVLSVDLHASQIQGFVDYPLDNLFAGPLLVNHLKRRLAHVPSGDLMIVSPNSSGAKRAENFANELKAGMSIFSGATGTDGKRGELVGDVDGKTCIIVGGLVDSAGTLTRVADELMAAGAKDVYASAVHGVCSDPCIERINNSQIKEFIVTNTIPMAEQKAKCSKMTVLSVAPLLSEAIQRIHNGGSLSQLFHSTEASFYDATEVVYDNSD